MTLDTPAAVVLELMTMGQQHAAHLGDLLGAASLASPHQELTTEILRCCGRVIDTLRAAAASTGRKRKAAEYQEAPPTPPAPGAWSPPPGPPLPKRRVRGSEAVKEVRSATTTVDGFIWRKYGQKEINGYEHPRLYYRCAHKQQQGCNATRRVQRTRDHPVAYEIAYYGDHTCRGAADACRLQGEGAPPPGVVDFGSTSWGSSADGSPAASVMSQGGGWSPSSVSPSPSSEAEAGFEAHAHEWHDAAALDLDMLMGAVTPCYASDPVTEFLDGCLGWESVLDDPLDWAGLHQHTALFQ